MSPRPRTVDDAAILGATYQVLSKLGPTRFTLADVAKIAGLAPATLVQRFGSKRGLLLAVATEGVQMVDACFDAARAATRSPLAALLAAATEMTRHMKTPEELANGLAFLQIDVSDPDFHALALENSERSIAGYRALLDEAVAAGELLPCDTRRLARAVGALSGGSLIAWAIHRDGDAESWVRGDLDTLLDPHRPTPRRGRRPAAKAAKATRTGARRRPRRS
jgi:AcrR family transcriptional regulator